MVSFTDHFNAITVYRVAKKLKLEKIHGTLIFLFYVSQSSPQRQNLFFFIKNT